MSWYYSRVERVQSVDWRRFPPPSRMVLLTHSRNQRVTVRALPAAPQPISNPVLMTQCRGRLLTVETSATTPSLAIGEEPRDSCYGPVESAAHSASVLSG